MDEENEVLFAAAADYNYCCN